MPMRMVNSGLNQLPKSLTSNLVAELNKEEVHFRASQINHFLKWKSSNCLLMLQFKAGIFSAAWWAKPFTATRYDQLICNRLNDKELACAWLTKCFLQSHITVLWGNMKTILIILGHLYWKNDLVRGLMCILEKAVKTKQKNDCF